MEHIKKMIVLLCMCLNGYSQAGKSELYAKLRTAPSDTDKIKLYISLSDIYTNENSDSSISLSLKALDIAKTANNEPLLCKAKMQVGITYQKQSNYKVASAYFFEALKIAEKTSDNDLKAQVYNSIATSFAYLKQYPMAEKYCLKAAEFFKLTGNEKRSATVLMNLGNIYYTREYPTGHFSECYKYYKEAVRIGEKNKDDELLSTAYGNLVLVYTDDGKFAEALKIINKARKLADRLDSKENKLFLDYYAGKTYSGMKDYAKAKSYFLESVRLSEEMKNKDYLSENYLSLSDLDYSMGNYKEAYDYYDKHKQLEDSLMSEENSRQLNELKTIYDTEKKEKELELSNQKIQTQGEKLRNQQTIIVSSIGGALLLLVLVLVLYNRSQIKQKANTKLEIAYATIEEKNKDITDSINYAQKIQYAILPDEAELKKVFTELFVLFKPRDVVSGDFYWFSETPQTKYIAVADCTGHGVPGAMMSMIGSSLLNQVVVEKGRSGTGEILDELREGIKAAFKQREGKGKQRDGMDIALVGFSTDMTQVQYSGANNGLYHITAGQLKEYRADKQPIGQHEGTESNFTTTNIALSPGDCLYLYSDGYADQFGGDKGKKFKYSQLKNVLLQIHTLAMDEQKNKLDHVFTEWKNNHEQVDDVLIIGIRV